MKILIGEEWSEGFLDYACGPDAVRIRPVRWLNIAEIQLENLIFKDFVPHDQVAQYLSAMDMSIVHLKPDPEALQEMGRAGLHVAHTQYDRSVLAGDIINILAPVIGQADSGSSVQNDH